MQPKVHPTKKATVWQSYQKQFSGIDFNVQDRRHHTRILLESMQRRNHLFPLSNKDIAHRLHKYRDEPSELLDDVQRRPDKVDWDASFIASKVVGRTPKAENEKSGNDSNKGELPALRNYLESSPSTSTEYEEWLTDGCPTTNWDVFLQEELYGPKKDRDTFYALKYSTNRCIKK
ncbi:unnamed protein product [Phytomonas sp. Hart1]|nr:unnamed protein product [Phytomonas sp. Hart1]|eukprot:CCW67426.1 unnamed protein product [Phytomonas sp. isolate Hart1]